VDAGRCYLYRQSGSDLLLVATLEEPSPQGGARFGHSVSVDGQTIAVSSLRSNEFSQDNGAVFVFEVSATSGVQFVAQLGPSPSATSSFFGTSVSLSADRLAVGAVYDSVDAVHAGAA
jgi:hypothetical protein